MSTTPPAEGSGEGASGQPAMGDNLTLPALPDTESTELFDVIGWALAVDLPASRAIGVHKVGRVLIALARHCDRNCEAFPSKETLAEEISDLGRRDVDNALRLLAEHGLISAIGKRGRTTIWRLNFTGSRTRARRPARDAQRRDAPPGRRTGDSTGQTPGYPGTKGIGTLGEGESDDRPHPRQCTRHQAGPNAVPCQGCAQARLAYDSAVSRAGSASPPRTSDRCSLPGHGYEDASSCRACRGEYLGSPTCEWPRGTRHRDAPR